MVGCLDQDRVGEQNYLLANMVIGIHALSMPIFHQYEVFHHFE